jgi:hypothetical protein
MCEQVARSDSTSVLIQGESGTGKELVANMVTRCRPAATSRSSEINCAAIPREILESELFGHEKGRLHRRPPAEAGLLELANGGTLFLDEVGEMSLSIQVKLLRVLERMTFRRVGGTKDIKVSVRIISATNQDLSRMVAEQQFREDLYYRLKVVPIFVPPLPRAPRGHPPPGQALHAPVLEGVRQELPGLHARGRGRPGELRLARQHPRAEEPDGAHRPSRKRPDPERADAHPVGPPRRPRSPIRWSAASSRCSMPRSSRRPASSSRS